jgi:cellulose synthase/poly-beta-1,6-N-acetylglucosamine synthase-like glycosyltransferase
MKPSIVEVASQLRSRRITILVRIWLYVILCIYLLGTALNLGVNCYTLFKPLRWFSDHAIRENIYELWLLAFPRIVMIFISAICLLPMAISLLWFKHEPIDLHLGDYNVWPSVDVFIPRYKEDWDLFRETLECAIAIQYPASKLQIYVCDDGSRAALGFEALLQPYIEKHDNIHYVTRENGHHAKAGNLNNALERSSGEIILVLDADMRAKRDILVRTLPHMLLRNGNTIDCDLGKSKIALVQTTQVYWNVDGLTAQMLDAEQIVWYRLMMPAFNGMGCAMCVGTNYIVQRAALLDIGGYVGGLAVEDVVTALELHAKGWTSKYIDCRDGLAVGLSPDTLSEMFDQRLRWIAGSIQLVWYRMPSVWRNLGASRILAYFSHAYPYYLTAFVVSCTVRLILAVVFAASYSDKVAFGMGLIIIEVAPICLYLGLMPIITVWDKITMLTSAISFLPLYMYCVWNCIMGRLDPAKESLKVKASSEAWGDRWPTLANVNVVWVLIACGSCMVVAFKTHVTPGGVIIQILLIALLVFTNAPVMIVFFRLCIRATKHYLGVCIGWLVDRFWIIIKKRKTPDTPERKRELFKMASFGSWRTGKRQKGHILPITETPV